MKLSSFSLSRSQHLELKLHLFDDERSLIFSAASAVMPVDLLFIVSLQRSVSPEWHKGEERTARSNGSIIIISIRTSQAGEICDLSAFSLDRNVNCNEQARQMKMKDRLFLIWSTQILGIRLVLLNELIVSIKLKDGKICFINSPTEDSSAMLLRSRNGVSPI